MKKIALLLILSFFASCKSKKLLAESKDASNEVTAQKIIQNYNNNNLNFSTLYIKANARYKDKNMSQGVTAEIKIKKDEKILVSVRVLGITMAKALITPQSVQYYEKPNGTYFEGDYIALSKWLGTDLDFNKVQNMLLGKTIDDLNKSDFIATIVEKLYKLQSKNQDDITKEYYFEAEKFLVRKQEISQIEKSRKLKIVYPEYQQKNELFLPLLLNIEAIQNENSTTIDIDYKLITINEEFTFPYAVPEGYERVYIQ